MFKANNQGVWDAFVESEMLHPIMRKLGRYPVYASRGFSEWKGIGGLVLGDYGSAVQGDEPHSHGIQPNQYRCPEVLFHREWSYAADIWNVGVLVSNYRPSARQFTDSTDVVYVRRRVPVQWSASCRKWIQSGSPFGRAYCSTGSSAPTMARGEPRNSDKIYWRRQVVHTIV